MPKSHPIELLLRRLDLEPCGDDRFVAGPPDEGRNHVFGGLVASQALVAATRTTSGLDAHSFHAYFLRAGDRSLPITYEVDRLRDGGSFATRAVRGVQAGQVIYSATVSFHRPEPGLSHQVPMPEAPPPESLPTSLQRFRELYARSENPVFQFILSIERPFDHRDPEPVDMVDPKPHRGTKRLWFRAAGPLPDDPNLHRAVVTYATDIGLLDNCIQYHGRTFLDPELFVASLDHAVWFHRPLRADQWLLYVMESPSAESGRGMNFGRIHQQDGTLVASVAQESLARFRRKA